MSPAGLLYLTSNWRICSLSGICHTVSVSGKYLFSSPCHDSGWWDLSILFVWNSGNMTDLEYNYNEKSNGRIVS